MRKLLKVFGIFIAATLLIPPLYSLMRPSFAKAEPDPWSCILPNTPRYPSNLYRSADVSPQRLSDDLLLFALAMYEAYEYGDKSASSLKVERLDETGLGKWSKQPPIRGVKSDLFANYYFRQTAEEFHVLIAFRGTMPDRIGNWNANFSWFTRHFRSSQYDEALTAFDQISLLARKLSGQKKLIFATTGHSLGGGLAMKIAYHYPCVTVVTFDTSPVVQGGKGKIDQAIVFKVFEDLDPLTAAFNWFTPFFDETNISRLKVNFVPFLSFQHSSHGIAFGALEHVAICQLKPGTSGCVEKSRWSNVKAIYCAAKPLYQFGVWNEICRQ